MKLLVLNGPNINMIGVREKDIYGVQSYQSGMQEVQALCDANNIEVKIYQSNHEGDLVDEIQAAYQNYDGIIINPGAYTHTSIAILDALKAVEIPTVEVHLSDVSKREDFRQISYVSYVAVKRIMGHGMKGYLEAVEYFMNIK